MDEIITTTLNVTLDSYSYTVPEGKSWYIISAIGGDGNLNISTAYLINGKPVFDSSGETTGSSAVNYRTVYPILVTSGDVISRSSTSTEERYDVDLTVIELNSTPFSIDPGETPEDPSAPGVSAPFVFDVVKEPISDIGDPAVVTGMLKIPNGRRDLSNGGLNGGVSTSSIVYDNNTYGATEIGFTLNLSYNPISASITGDPAYQFVVTDTTGQRYTVAGDDSDIETPGLAIPLDISEDSNFLLFTNSFDNPVEVVLNGAATVVPVVFNFRLRQGLAGFTVNASTVTNSDLVPGATSGQVSFDLTDFTTTFDLNTVSQIQATFTQSSGGTFQRQIYFIARPNTN